ncbi:MAG: OmpA family protein [Cyclobacteriaceae bacterium]|nr:OmpA family protein [Cyclobacteriaceae bacterium]
MTFRLSTFILSLVCVFSAHAQQVDKNDFNTLLQKINTRYDEQNPIVGPDGKTLYFTRANDSLNIGGTKDKGDIWVSRLGSDGVWGSATNLGRPINDELKNHMLGFSPDGNIMFLNHEKKNPGGIVVNDGISYAVRTGNTWSKPVRLSVDYLLNKSAHQSGSISADGRYLLLSLQAYASRGEEDIYISTYQDGAWSQPVNLGSDINTSGQEMTPYLSPDQQKLYFSSNGHSNKGGLDLYVAERQGEGWTSWSKPKNLGSSINSIGVELNYFIDINNSIAYYSSTQNSDGYGDINAHEVVLDTLQKVQEEVFDALVVKAEELKKTITLSGAVSNKKTNEPIAAALNIRINGDEYNTNADESTGVYSIELPLETNMVNINVKSPGFMGTTASMQLSATGAEQNFALAPLEIGETIQLNKVYFERGTAILLDDSFEELDQLADMLTENPNVKIELSGHTDNQGDSKLNLGLSQERVERVKIYLTEHGIDAKRIKGKGYGGTKPLASNASEETRKLNRRVEITILKN